MGISIGQLLVVLVIVALLFGTKKLRNIGGDLGNAIKSFRSAMKDDDDSAPPSKSGNIIEGESSASSESDHRDT